MLAKGERLVSVQTPKGKWWAIVPSPEEGAAIGAAIASDPDAVELTDEEFEGLRPVSETSPDIIEWSRAVQARRARESRAAQG